MLSVEEYDQVNAICMSYRFFGREVSQAFVYLVDGLLIDTGLPKSGAGLIEVINAHELRLIVNTFHNPESMGNNALLQKTFSVPIRAHKEAVEKIKYPRKERIVNRWLWGQPLTSKVSKLKSIIRFKDYYFRVFDTFGIDPVTFCLNLPGLLLVDDCFTGSRRVRLRELSSDLKRKHTQSRVLLCKQRV